MGIKALYYITHINNLPSILKHGILSHELVKQMNLQPTLIYDSQIVKDRRDIQTPDGKSLWEYANLYFKPQNPMLYRVLCERPAEEICILSIKPTIMKLPGVFVTDGNAASSLTEFIRATKENEEKIREIIDRVNSLDWWARANGTKRKIMAECLVPNKVPPEDIIKIYVVNHEVAKKIKSMLPQVNNIPIIPEKTMFFRPPREIHLTTNLTLVEGDMFLSRMQTLTISVNCVGVMGRGLASRAKYQFPEVYVYYQELCKKKKLRMGKPYLYKSELSLDYELADSPQTLSSMKETWFLLFPTKRHWRERANKQGIERGLQWLVENYKKEGIESLAIPALGCGLGWLRWEEMGPLLCKYLTKLDIPVQLYLPAEKEIPEEQLSKNFLLA